MNIAKTYCRSWCHFYQKHGFCPLQMSSRPSCPASIPVLPTLKTRHRHHDGEDHVEMKWRETGRKAASCDRVASSCGAVTRSPLICHGIHRWAHKE